MEEKPSFRGLGVQLKLQNMHFLLVNEVMKSLTRASLVIQSRLASLAPHRRLCWWPASVCRPHVGSPLGGPFFAFHPSGCFGCERGLYASTPLCV